VPTQAYAVVLAAGSGSRFGGGKLVAPFRGKPLVTHAALAVAEAIGRGLLAGGVAVLPERDAQLAWHLDLAGLRPIENPEAGTGLASSLRCGLAAIEDLPDAGAALIVLADQPFLRVEVIEALVAAWRKQGRSARPRYAARPDAPGHPVLLDRGLWHLARELTGDHGLGALLASRPEAMTTVDVSGANPDVDTRGDLSQLEGQDG